MECLICIHETTNKGYVTVKLEGGEAIICFKNVPANVCENYRHYYLDEYTAMVVLSEAENAISHGAELEVMRYREVA
jgi:hypothetical protein